MTCKLVVVRTIVPTLTTGFNSSKQIEKHLTCSLQNMFRLGMKVNWKQKGVSAFISSSYTNK